MNPSIVAEVERLRQLKTAALRTRYREVLGEESRSSNRQSLLRRIAWRLQARAEGDLSERARRRAVEIADDADLRLRAPKDFLAVGAPSPVGASADRIGSRRDARLPVPGTVLTRQYYEARFGDSRGQGYRRGNAHALQASLHAKEHAPDRHGCKSPERVSREAAHSKQEPAPSLVPPKNSRVLAR